MPPQFPPPGFDGSTGTGVNPPSPLEFGAETKGLMSSLSGLAAARKPIVSRLVKDLTQTAEKIRELDPKLSGRYSRILSIARGEAEGFSSGGNE